MSGRRRLSARMAAAPGLGPLEAQGPEPPARCASLSLLVLIGTIGHRLPGSHHGRIDVLLPLPAAGEAAAITVDLADLAGREAPPQQDLQGAARKVVEPEEVKVTIAAAFKVCAIWRAAAVMAAGEESSVS